MWPLPPLPEPLLPRPNAVGRSAAIAALLRAAQWREAIILNLLLESSFSPARPC